MVLSSHNNKKVCKGRFLVLKKTKKRSFHFLNQYYKNDRFCDTDLT